MKRVREAHFTWKHRMIAAVSVRRNFTHSPPRPVLVEQITRSALLQDEKVAIRPA
jgi:hypothetical protein